jgi:ribosomal protein L1
MKGMIRDLPVGTKNKKSIAHHASDGESDYIELAYADSVCTDDEDGEQEEKDEDMNNNVAVEDLVSCIYFRVGHCIRTRRIQTQSILIIYDI